MKRRKKKISVFFSVRRLHARISRVAQFDLKIKTAHCVSHAHFLLSSLQRYMLCFLESDFRHFE